MKLPLRAPARPALTQLEGREVPALFTALGADGLTLVGYDSDAPATVLSKATVTGLDAGATLVGIDYRGTNSKLYGVASNSRLYTVDPASGAATAVGATFTTALSGTVYGVDFNPAADKLRIVSNTGQNLRVNADTGAIAGVDTALSYDATTYDQVVGGTAPTPNVVAVAYTQNPPATGTTPVTTLYDIDATLSLLSTQGTSSDNTGTDLVSPNTGKLFPVDKLGFTPGANVGFDIQAGTDLALVSVGNKLYSVSLTTAGTISTGNLPTGASFKDLAIQPAATGAGTFALPSAALSFPDSRGPLAVTVTRTGGASVAATVDYATSGGTAVAGTDYLPASGTLSFAAGETTKLIVLQLPAGPATPGAAKTFNLTLTNATGGATLGTAAAAVTIPAVATPPTSERGRYFAAGAGVGGGPRVTVYDAATGATVGNFFAYESTFTGGVTVASADFNGDGVDDIVVGSGVGGGPRVRIFDGATLTAASPTIIADFFAYESTFRGGVNVAAGDVTGDGLPEVIAGAGVGGGPRVRVITLANAQASANTGNTAAATNDFFAYEDTFRGGVTVAVGELTGDSRADIVAGSGVGGGPRVRVFDATVVAAGSSTPAALSDFFAYDQAFRSGVNVGTGTVLGDGTRSVLTGVGTGGGPDVRVFTSTGTQKAQFFGYDSALRGGVRVAAADFGANGTDELLISSGPGGPPRVKLVNTTGAEIAAVQPFESTYLGGVFVG